MNTEYQLPYTGDEIVQKLKTIDSLEMEINTLTLGVYSDELVYIFKDGKPVGTGIKMGTVGDVFGYIDENNNIIVSGNLADGEYTIKYENEDGTYTDVGTLEVSKLEPDMPSEPDTPSYTNLAIPDETATGQSAWESGGWCNDSYMAGTSYAYRAATDGRITTNTFAVEYGDTIYVKGIKYSTGSTTQIALFEADGTYIKHHSAYNMSSQKYVTGLTATEGEDYWYFVNKTGSNTDNGSRLIRLAGVPSGDIADIIITRNQPIE